MFLLLRDKNGQIAPFMVLVMAVLILAIAATVIIGETGFTRLRMANIADSALISGASAFCRNLNSMRPIHNQMLYNYITFQTSMLIQSPFLHKATAYAEAAALTALYVEQSYSLFDDACKIADKMPQELRTSAYDTTLGGALIDEPKPFREVSGVTPYHQVANGVPVLPNGTSIYSVDTCNEANLSNWNEVGRDQNGVVNYLDYTKYLQRDSNFMCKYRALKFGNSGWYNSSSLAYSFNKSKTGFSAYPGLIALSPDETIIDPATGKRKYEAYLSVRLNNFPDSVDIIPMVMPIVFLYWEWCVICYTFACVYQPCFILPGFTVDPFAWIASIDFNSNFSLTLNRRVPFTRIPFFSQSVELQHTSRVNINGSVWSGYDFSIQ
ncbi:MAG: hypothetical protein NT033_07485 [Candidatus Omnitrophica bacterium]|nr:hypothetical protein [Candidatus Omnitrophota bacterium]